MRYAVRWSVLLCSLAAICAAGARSALSGADAVTISQRDQRFQPGAVSIRLGQPLVVVNDDGATVHHAYVEADAFNFDSGDQIPGAKTTIVFPVKGDFQVLCGIHQKMKLDVHVR